MTKKRLTSSASSLPSAFADLLGEVKLRIQRSQTRAMFSVNAELIRLYWDIGRLIEDRQQREGWGAAVIPRLSAELRNELPELKGFSTRNIDRMVAFYRCYPEPSQISPQPAAKSLGSEDPSQAEAMTAHSLKSPQAAAKTPARGKVQQAAAKMGEPPKVPQTVAQIESEASLLWSIPWFHHVILIEKVKDLTARRWYMEQTLVNGWSRNVLTLMIDSDAYRRTSNAVSNFEQQLPAPQSDLVQQTLKDPYIFDFLTLTTPTFQPGRLNEQLRPIYADRRSMDEPVHRPGTNHLPVATLRASQAAIRCRQPQMKKFVFPPTLMMLVAGNAKRTVQFSRGHVETPDQTV